MTKFKLGKWKKSEIFSYILIIGFILWRGVFEGDYFAAVISAICGITYTVLAGKGVPLCNLIGATGSGFYGLLSFQNALWGNLILYVCYYIPMQVLAFFNWQHHLKKNENVIVKISLPKKEFLIIILITLVCALLAIYILEAFNDSHPIQDGITTVVSVTGMYLTLKRAIEQWIAWMIVNSLSLFMWINVAVSGVKVIPTIIMWSVYLFLAFYFYLEWRRELHN